MIALIISWKLKSYTISAERPPAPADMIIPLAAKEVGQIILFDFSLSFFFSYDL